MNEGVSQDRLSRIEHISDTARWMAHFRALESCRGDALFKDPFAARLADVSGPAIAQRLGSVDSIARAIAVRTAVFDELITQLIDVSGVDIVLNLAAGLDARPWRLPLSRDLQWVDVDLPGVLEYKTTILRGERTRCQYQSLPADITDAEARASLFPVVGRMGRRALVITEGLLVYLSSQQVATLGADLHRQDTFGWWLTDIVGPRALRFLQQTWQPILGDKTVRFQFAPTNSADFFQTSGWKEDLYRSSRAEASRYGRPMPMPWPARMLLWFSSAPRREEFWRLSGVARLSAIR